MRSAGSAGAYNGRSTATLARSTDAECSHPTRSAITDAGIDGNSASSARILGSNPSTSEPTGPRSYFGGESAANAARTVFRANPVLRTIALILICSDLCNRRISAQSSVMITPSQCRGGQNSIGTRGSGFTRQRQSPHTTATWCCSLQRPSDHPTHRSTPRRPTPERTRSTVALRMIIADEVGYLPFEERREPILPTRVQTVVGLAAELLTWTQTLASDQAEPGPALGTQTASLRDPRRRRTLHPQTGRRRRLGLPRDWPWNQLIDSVWTTLHTA